MTNSEIDAILAEKIMGWSPESGFAKEFHPHGSINDAFAVVEKIQLQKPGTVFELGGYVGRFSARFIGEKPSGWESSETPAMAISLAAVKVVEGI